MPNALVKRWFGMLFLVVAMLLASSASFAAFVNLSATIDGAQADAGAGTGSAGTGSAAMVLDTNTNEFLWAISWSGLSGPATAAHFHGPAAPDMNAGVQVNIPVLTSPSLGMTTLVDAQVADLLNNLWYINIHTAAFPGGEIRGQVIQAIATPIPIPAALGLFGAGLASLAFLRRRKQAA